MAFQIVFRPQARLDIERAVAWSARMSPGAAIRWRRGLLNILKDLEVDPARHPLAEEAADLGMELRQLLYGRRQNSYRILFEIDGETVAILRVRHAAQDRLSAEDV